MWNLAAVVNLADLVRAWTKTGLFTEGHNAVSLNSMRVEAGQPVPVAGWMTEHSKYFLAHVVLPSATTLVYR